MNITALYNLYSESFLVDTDTRKIRKNTMYFALKGENFNGNTFALEALKKGASYSIVDEKEYATTTKIILVEDVLATLQELAKYHRKKLNTPIISLTGSNGKTTTKELINAVLSTQYNITATVGNLNNHIGVPLTLLSMTPSTEIGIVEMGANHHKEIEFLCSITNPDYGYITNFGKAHLEGFGSLEGVIEAKSEMYEYLHKTNKSVFVNTSDKIQVEKTKNINSINLNQTIKHIGSNPFVSIEFNGETLQTNLMGGYNFDNLSAAITIGEYFNISSDNIKKAIETYTPTNNRSQLIKTKNNTTIILDAYNANPSSMKAALDNFSLINSKDKMVILGDMFELGSDSLQEHQNIIDYCSKLRLIDSIFVGGLFYQAKTNSLKIKTFEELKEHIAALNLKNKHILIKGSRGMALERIVAIIH